MANSTAFPELFEGDEYGDMHRIVLQGLISQGFLDAKGVKRLFMSACTYLKMNPDSIKMQYIQKVVREINDKIKSFDMAIKSASCELTGVKYYIFLITVEKPIMKLQNIFTKFELELLQKSIDVILRKYSSFSVPAAECINMTKEMENRCSLQQAEDFIHRLIQMNYFTKYPTEDGDWEVTLGFRGIREFEPMLRELYQDVMAKCSLCKMLLLHGYLCPKCKLLVHKACYSRYMKSASGNQCPNCKSAIWGKESHLIRRVRDVEEAEVEVDFNEPSSSKSQQPETPMTNPASVETEISEDSNSEMPVLEPQANPRGMSAKGGVSKGIKSKSGATAVSKEAASSSGATDRKSSPKRGSGGGVGGSGGGRGRNSRPRKKLNLSESESE